MEIILNNKNEKEMYIQIILIIAAILFLYILLLSNEETDQEKDFENYVEDHLHDKFCTEYRHKGKCSAKGIPLETTEVFQLKEGVQMVLIGVNHEDPWALYMITPDDREHLIEPVVDGKYWYQRFTFTQEPDAINVQIPFEIQEIVWGAKDYISMKAFALPHIKKQPEAPSLSIKDLQST